MVNDMSTLGVDVSSYNGIIDWRSVKKAGYDFAILKIIRKDGNPDKGFERNWVGCEGAKIEVKGVYNYSYATNVEKAVKDAQAVVKILNGREVMVWLDIEDKCQTNLGYGLVSIINAYQNTIEKAGLKFGVYTGLSFYNSYLKKFEGRFKCPLWIARYGRNNGLKDNKYQPQIDNLMGWQYTSNGKVNGINGKVDLNVFYDVKGSKEVVRNPYPVPTRLLYAKRILGRWVCRGDDVKYVQFALAQDGFIAAKDIDGVYGRSTEDAVKRFQERVRKEKGVNISVDGVVGSETRRYM